MIGQDNRSQACDWLSALLQSANHASGLSHDNLFCNSESPCPMNMKSCVHVDLTTKLNILPICFVSFTGFEDMDDRNFIVLVGAASHQAYFIGLNVC